jgi:tetratricopeptide (TPR) repeat protein
MLEQALFEEEQAQISKARKIFENLQNDIAPDCIKTLLAFINFEKRQGNVEKVKELYFKAFNSSLERKESEAVAYIVVQYARYLAFKCNDSNRAVEIMNQALAKCSQGNSKTSKTLYLSYANFLKHLDGVIPDVYTKIVSVFEKALDTTSSTLSASDLQEVARFYLEYLQENCH